VSGAAQERSNRTPVLDDWNRGLNREEIMLSRVSVVRAERNGGLTEKSTDYLIFRVRRQEFALLSERIHEIRSVPSAKDSPPKAEGEVIGSIILHRQPIPVIDLARRLGLPPSRRNTRRFVIVLPFSRVSGQQFMVGFLVDAVSSVVNIPDARIGSPDSKAPPASTGRVRINGRFKYLFEPTLLLSAEEIAKACALPPASVIGSVA
jgi:purine-binding chemotaxis protein CheW